MRHIGLIFALLLTLFLVACGAGPANGLSENQRLRQMLEWLPLTDQQGLDTVHASQPMDPRTYEIGFDRLPPDWPHDLPLPSDRTHLVSLFETRALAVFRSGTAPEECLAWYREALAAQGWQQVIRPDVRVFDIPVAGVNTSTFSRDDPPGWLRVSVVSDRERETLARLEYLPVERERLAQRHRLPFLPVIRLSDCLLTSADTRRRDHAEYTVATSLSPQELMDRVDRAFVAAGCEVTSSVDGRTLSMKTWATRYRNRPIVVECQVFRSPGLRGQLHISLRVYQPDGSAFLIL